jgi:CrcB protein
MILVVGCAGILGALSRFYLGTWIQTWWIHPFPLGTLLINYLGCIVLGWFTCWTTNRANVPAWLRIAFGTGFVGSFTTFSTFSAETVELLRNGLWGTAVLYVLLSLWGGLFLAWCGSRLARRQTDQRKVESK